MGERSLTAEELTAATGETNLDRIVEIELIFSGFHELEGLERCPNLRNLSVINGKLERISNLIPVSQTLTRLCLCNQNLSKMEGLYLPQLQQLFLHQNKISKIEGLERCPKLQKLWLYSNQISTIENLHPCGDLRELWLQDNRISQINGLDAHPLLHTLSLANNHIASFDHLLPLQQLSGLRHLTLDDAHFGVNPVTSIKGYRSFVVTQIKQLRLLDGVEISTNDKRAAEDAYVTQVLRFNDRMDDILRAHEQEVLAIDSRRNRNCNQADTMRTEVLQAFKELEHVVTSGRDRIQTEHGRQLEARQKSLVVVQRALDELKAQYSGEIDRQIEREQQKMQDEDELYQLMEKRVEFEKSQVLFITELKKHQELCFQFLPDHSPDWRYIASFFVSHESDAKQRHVELKLLQVYRVFNEALSTRYEAQLTESITQEYVFCTGTRHALEQLLVNGIKGQILLFSDPSVAAFYHSVVDESYAIVCCRLAVDSTNRERIELTKQPESIEQISTLASNPKVQYELKYTTKPAKSGSIYVLSEAHYSQYLVPQFHILCVAGLVAQKEERLEELFLEMRMPSFAATQDDDEKDVGLSRMLEDFQRKADEEIEMYQQRFQRDMDPDVASKIQQYEAETNSVQEAIESLRIRIDDEKAAQEQLLRNAKQRRR